MKKNCIEIPNLFKPEQGTPIPGTMVRFHLESGEIIDVELRGNSLVIHHERLNASRRVALCPEFANQIRVALVNREDLPNV